MHFLFIFFNWGFPELIHFPLHKAVQWGADGRPFHFLFYTGKQSYYSLMHVSTAVQLEQRAALSVKPSSPSNPQLFLTCSLPASRTLGSYPIQTEWVERRRCRSLEEQRSQILFSTQRCEGRGGRTEGGEASRRSEVVQLNMRISGGNLLQRWRLIFTCLDSCWTFWGHLSSVIPKVYLCTMNLQNIVPTVVFIYVFMAYPWVCFCTYSLRSGLTHNLLHDFLFFL